jgi:hypothetical protein
VNTFKIDYLSYGQGTYAKGSTNAVSAITAYATMSYALTNAVAANKMAKPVFFGMEDYNQEWINWAP